MTSQVEFRRGSLADLPLLEPLWVSVHHHHAEVMPDLAPLGAIAAQLRERLDGSGYPRGLSAGAISQPALILGAADAYQSMREPRPHRRALSAAAAAAQLRAEVSAGRMDPDAAEAVLAAAGHAARHAVAGSAPTA